MRKFKKQNAFTLPELLISTLILMSIFAGGMLTFLKCMELSDMARNTSAAVLAAKNKLTEIDNASFTQILASYNNASFDIANINGKGIVYIDDSAPNIVKITAVVSWKQGNGRIIGEDSNLNGQLDAGEDKNGNGSLDSLVQFVTLKYAI